MTKRIAAIAGLVLVLGATAVVAIAIWPERAGVGDPAPTVASSSSQPPGDGIPGSSPAASGAAGELAQAGPRLSLPPPDPHFLLQPAEGKLPVHHSFKHPPLAGILFDVKSGRILWQRNPRLRHPIASLTKMMTALLVAQHDPPGARVKISAKAAQAPGSATGLLPADERSRSRPCSRPW